ncbi:MAG: trypsin-like peptidase domain-containing protein [Tissierellales bacterium]|jgi:serine protease Do|nr:trypsin-like peptidase domain-containing protein [Tissierellales bacterium]
MSEDFNSDNNFKENEAQNPNVRIWSEPAKKSRLSFPKILVLGVVCSATAGSFIGVGYNIASSYIPKTQTVVAQTIPANNVQNISFTSTDSPITKIYEDVNPSIVSITNKFTTEDFFMREIVQEGQGSGIIFNTSDDELLIVTNYHVVQGANNLTIHFSSGETAEASIVGGDAQTDLAVVKVPKENLDETFFKTLKPATFGSSDNLKIGEPAIAIGSPVNYENSATVGVISGLNRKLNLSGRNLTLIQTDAAINPGNSGGALLNIAGEVIGINTVKIADTEVEGIGFAIPITDAMPIIDDLVNNGHVERPYLGIAGKNVTDELSDLYELPVGVFVQYVYENSPADKAGLEPKDIIVEFDGLKLPTMTDIKNNIKSHEVGDEVKLVIIRDNKRIEFKATLDTIKSN